MPPAAWFSLGLAVGINLTVGVLRLVKQFDARASQYVRPAGSPVVVRITGRKPA